MSSEKTPSEKRLAILDLLRFVAAILVLLYHYHYYFLKETGSNIFSAFKFGYLGVNFFFMLSGFVIMASAKNTGAFKFALLRALRLYPAFIVCLILTLCVLSLTGNALPSITSIILNGLIVNDYFNVPNIDGVYWTLQAELKFYGCVFLLILFNVLPQYRIWLTIWLGAAIFFHFSSQPFFLGWFISPSYSFFFIGGVAAYLFSEKKDNFILAVYVLAMIFAATKAWGQIGDFCKDYDQVDQIVAVSVSVIFFIFFGMLKRLNALVPASQWFFILGGMSYPLYLIHSRAGLAFVDAISESIGIHASLGLGVLLVLLMSWCIYMCIERPLFKLARPLIR